MRLVAAQHIPANLISEIPDRQFIAGKQLAFRCFLAIDANAIGAAQIANDQIIVDLGQNAMAPGNFFGLQLHIALGMATEQKNRFIDENAWPVGQG